MYFLDWVVGYFGVECPISDLVRIPLLGKGGVAARPRKFREATLARADGVVRSSHRLIGSRPNHPEGVN